MYHSISSCDFDLGIIALIRVPHGIWATSIKVNVKMNKYGTVILYNY